MVVFPDLRERLAKVHSLTEFRLVGEEIKQRCSEEHERYLRDPSSVDRAGLLLPHWILQPYVRPTYVFFLPLHTLPLTTLRTFQPVN
jgi:hypothetical protein